MIDPNLIFWPKTNARVHGNGFIQLDLSDTHRLHIWGDPRIPRQKTYTPIHDHVFGFKSTILVGRLLNVVYGFHRVTYGDYRVFTPTIRQGEDTVLSPTTERVRVFPIRTDLVEQNTAHRNYEMDPFIFHETFATEPSATLIVKTGPTQAQGATAKPRVLVCWDQEPDNDFNRYDVLSVEAIREITEDVLRRQ